jgi:hypothetical protein
MDAEYYYTGGLQLASGRGFQEPFLWNYLDNPTGLPHPSHTYWMPLASIVAALLPGITGNSAFDLARIPFFLIAGLAAPLTAALSYSFECNKKHAVMAGVLAIFPGYYLAYYPTTDTFAIYMVLGAVFLLVGKTYLSANRSRRYPLGFVLGLVAGLMHLARADGLLWFGFAGGLIIYTEYIHRDLEAKSGGRAFMPILVGFLLAGAGYLIPMGAWLARNTGLYGSLFSPAGGHALWLRSYNELFLFPADSLNFERWWAQGIGEILSVRVQALQTNLKTAIGVQFGIFLLPFALVGLWKYRMSKLVRLGAIGWLGTFLAMTLVFPFAGARGGFFHSGAAVQPFLWSLVPAGLAVLVDWVGKLRGWEKTRQAKNVFSLSLVGMAVVVTFALGFQMVVGDRLENPTWNQSWAESARLAGVLDELGIPVGETILVNNPPGFYAASSRPAIVIPDGGPEMSIAAARRYGSSYLILEKNHPEGLNNLYADPETGSGFELLKTAEGVHFFRILP